MIAQEMIGKSDRAIRARAVEIWDHNTCRANDNGWSLMEHYRFADGSVLEYDGNGWHAFPAQKQTTNN